MSNLSEIDFDIDFIIRYKFFISRKTTSTPSEDISLFTNWIMKQINIPVNEYKFNDNSIFFHIVFNHIRFKFKNLKNHSDHMSNMDISPIKMNINKVKRILNRHGKTNKNQDEIEKEYDDFYQKNKLLLSKKFPYYLFDKTNRNNDKNEIQKYLSVIIYCILNIYIYYLIVNDFHWWNYLNDQENNHNKYIEYIKIPQVFEEKYNKSIKNIEINNTNRLESRFQIGVQDYLYIISYGRFIKNIKFELVNTNGSVYENTIESIIQLYSMYAFYMKENKKKENFFLSNIQNMCILKKINITIPVFLLYIRLVNLNKHNQNQGTYSIEKKSFTKTPFFSSNFSYSSQILVYITCLNELLIKNSFFSILSLFENTGIPYEDSIKLIRLILKNESFQIEIIKDIVKHRKIIINSKKSLTEVVCNILIEIMNKVTSKPRVFQLRFCLDFFSELFKKGGISKFNLSKIIGLDEDFKEKTNENELIIINYNKNISEIVFLYNYLNIGSYPSIFYMTHSNEIQNFLILQLYIVSNIITRTSNDTSKITEASATTLNILNIIRVVDIELTLFFIIYKIPFFLSEEDDNKNNKYPLEILSYILSSQYDHTLIFKSLSFSKKEFTFQIITDLLSKVNLVFISKTISHFKQKGNLKIQFLIRHIYQTITKNPKSNSLFSSYIIRFIEFFGSSIFSESLFQLKTVLKETSCIEIIRFYKENIDDTYNEDLIEIIYDIIDIYDSIAKYLLLLFIENLNVFYNDMYLLLESSISLDNFFNFLITVVSFLSEDDKKDEKDVNYIKTHKINSDQSIKSEILMILKEVSLKNLSFFSENSYFLSKINNILRKNQISEVELNTTSHISNIFTNTDENIKENVRDLVNRSIECIKRVNSSIINNSLYKRKEYSHIKYINDLFQMTKSISSFKFKKHISNKDIIIMSTEIFNSILYINTMTTDFDLESREKGSNNHEKELIVNSTINFLICLFEIDFQKNFKKSSFAVKLNNTLSADYYLSSSFSYSSGSIIIDYLNKKVLELSMKKDCKNYNEKVISIYILQIYDRIVVYFKNTILISSLNLYLYDSILNLILLPSLKSFLSTDTTTEDYMVITSSLLVISKIIEHSPSSSYTFINSLLRIAFKLTSYLKNNIKNKEKYTNIIKSLCYLYIIIIRDIPNEHIDDKLKIKMYSTVKDIYNISFSLKDMIIDYYINDFFCIFTNKYYSLLILNEMKEEIIRNRLVDEDETCFLKEILKKEGVFNTTQSEYIVKLYNEKISRKQESLKNIDLDEIDY